MMRWINTTTQYGVLAISLHWVLAILIFFMLLQGNIMDGIPKDDPLKGGLYALHKIVGMVILCLVVARLANRILAMPKSAAIPSQDRWWAKGIQYALYVLMLIMPVSGWMMSSLAHHPPNIFGIDIELPMKPNLWNIDWKPLAHDTHHFIGSGIFIGVILLHLFGVFKHVICNRINLFKRMWYD